MNKMRTHQVDQPTQSTVWSQYLQRRVMRLLLLHDKRLFHKQFRLFFTQSVLPQIPVLQFYDRYIKLRLLSDDLFEHIMPNLRRQLSLQRDIVRRQEEPPTLGEIDWTRTVERTVNEMPDQPPFLFDTQMQQQHTATPENLLVVAILMAYQRVVRDTLYMDRQEEILHEEERQSLIGAEERVERELSVQYAHAMSEEANHADIETLAEQVAPSLKPGLNPYTDLLVWWQQFQELHIGKTSMYRHPTVTNKQNVERLDMWLYELWLALEILDLLTEHAALVSESIEINGDYLSFVFTWGERRFRFHYKRQGTAPTTEAQGWKHIYAATPSYTVEREQPLIIQVKEQVIWQEPPVLLFANYSADTAVVAHTQDALEKLLGCMKLTSSRQAFFLSPIAPDPTISNIVRTSNTTYIENIDSQGSIYPYRIPPDIAQETLRRQLQNLVQQITDFLPERPAPACYGVLLDTDTVNPSRQYMQQGNVLCPKPHIGHSVFDLVDDKLHCLRDSRLCHVYGQAIIPPFVIRVSTLDELEKHGHELRARSEKLLRQAEDVEDEARAEQLRQHIFLGVGRSMEQYVKRHGNTKTLEVRFEEWIFGDYWKQHARSLSPEARDYLLSGEYVWDEYTNATTLQDWGAPAIQYCRALEHEIRRRLYNHYPQAKTYYSDVRQKGFDKPLMLGNLETIYQYRERQLTNATPPKDRDKIKSAQHNWPLCEAIVTHSGSNIDDFKTVVERMLKERTSQRRNKLAHGEPVSQSEAQALRETIIGRKGKPGILLWLVEHLEPKRQ